MARTVAGLAGQELVELALSGGTDTSDLLGGFEQLEPSRRLQVVPISGLHSNMGMLWGLKWDAVCSNSLKPSTLGLCIP